jgi:hypothetical protein
MGKYKITDKNEYFKLQELLSQKCADGLIIKYNNDCKEPDDKPIILHGVKFISADDIDNEATFTISFDSYEGDIDSLNKE